MTPSGSSTRSGERRGVPPDEFIERSRPTLRLGRLALLLAVAVLVVARAPGLGAVRAKFAGPSAGWIAASALLEIGTVTGFVAFHAAFERRMRPALSASIGMVAQGVNVLVRDPLLAAGALAFVLLDVGVLAAAFHALGSGGLPLGSMLLAYTLGQTGSVIPLPGTP